MIPRARSVRPEAEESRQANGQVEDLGVRKRAAQPFDESVVDARVVRGEAFGVLHGQALLLR